MASSSRKRADILLVERGLFESRARAQAAIEAGNVTANDVPVIRPSDIIPTDAVLQAEPAHPYVSRGGVKLAGALVSTPKASSRRCSRRSARTSRRKRCGSPDLCGPCVS